MFVWWGASLINLYNAPYRAILGGKHPQALGQPAPVVWREVWKDVSSRVEAAMRGNVGTYDEALLLIMERNGYPEETYYTFSYSPIPDDAGGTGGIICANTDDTQRIMGSRQLALLRELAARAANPRTVQEACSHGAQALASDPRDLPFALIYLLDPKRSRLHLAGSSGIAPGHQAAPESVSLDGEDPWSLAHVVRTNERRLVAPIPESVGALPAGAWSLSPRQAVAIPIAGSGESACTGVLVAGVNPFRQLDDNYQGFLGLVTGQIAASVASARAFEEERRRTEALAELDRAKTAFFSNVSHEFRTPLMLILSPLEDSLGTADGAPTREQTALIYRNGLRLLKLVNSLLDFARIEAGRVQASYRPTDLSALTTDLASAFRSLVERSGLRLVVKAPPLSEPVYVDRSMFEKIVLNLLSNAFKFTFEGEIEVSLAERARAAVELTVRDTGIGIPEHEIPRLFERFHRVEGAEGRSHEGSGIGLALIHELVRLHKGSVRVESSLGRGTTFIVSIPRGRDHLPQDRIDMEATVASTSLRADAYVEEASRWVADAPGPVRPDDPTPSDASPRRPLRRAPRILLADDNADMRSYVSRLLSGRYEVEAVADGEAALAAVRRQVPDLVLTDVMMPRLDGFGLLQELRKSAATRGIPVILLSARAGEESRVEGLNAGADDYLTKPFSARELLARVGAHVELARVRREAAMAIVVRNAQFEAVFNAAPIGLYLIDRHFRIRQVNPTALPVFGNIPGLIGRDFDEVIHILWPKAYADEIVRHFRRTLETGEPFVVPERAEERLDRGLVEYYEWRIDRVPLPDGHGVLCYFRDISQQVRAREALKEADRRKDEFLAMLAHELRNPLAPITTALHLVRARVGARDDVARPLAVMNRQTQHLARLVDDLLEVSRITRGKIRLERQVLDAALAVSRAVEISRPVIDAKKHSLTVALPHEPVWIDADLTRLAQVLGNLLNNAAKYTDQGGRISVALAREGKEAVFRVVDNGVGIPSELMPRLFELFTQADTSLDRSEGGLGIGLTLARGLVELHGGTIEARSAGPGRGSEFVVRLPLASKPARDDRSGAPAPLAASERRRIVVVDDNVDAAESLAEFLRDSGHGVEVAYDGASALGAIRANAPEVVFLDIGLPRLDGYEVARAIRREHGSGITLVALTGYGQEEDRRRTKEAGFDHHLVKPVHLETLSRLLAGSSSSTSAR